MEKIQDKAPTASAWIWQSLVVSSDTAGALWVSGNDALPRNYAWTLSSFDEGFVRSNAVL